MLYKKYIFMYSSFLSNSVFFISLNSLETVDMDIIVGALWYQFSCTTKTCQKTVRSLKPRGEKCARLLKKCQKHN